MIDLRDDPALEIFARFVQEMRDELLIPGGIFSDFWETATFCGADGLADRLVNEREDSLEIAPGLDLWWTTTQTAMGEVTRYGLSGDDPLGLMQQCQERLDRCLIAVSERKRELLEMGALRNRWNNREFVAEGAPPSGFVPSQNS